MPMLPNNAVLLCLALLAGCALLRLPADGAPADIPRLETRLYGQSSWFAGGTASMRVTARDHQTGQPVSGAAVRIVLAPAPGTADAPAARTLLRGRTNALGTLDADLRVPSWAPGSYQLRVTVSGLGEQDTLTRVIALRDSAAKAEEEKRETVTTGAGQNAGALRLAVIPESGRLVPNVENTLYILAATPEGAPAQADLTITLRTTRLAANLQTDASGIAEWRVVPRRARIAGNITARDAAGNYAATPFEVGGETAGGVILRADKALYAAGEPLRLNVVAPDKSGTVHVDLVRAGQVVLTRSVPLRDGAAGLTIPLPAELSGTLQAHAYRVQEEGEVASDTRAFFVAPGIADESVFALGEMPPGREWVYRLLAREIAEACAGARRITPADLDRKADDAGQRAAAILFAALPRQPEYPLMANSYDEKMARLRARWMTRMKGDAERIIAALRAHPHRTRPALTSEEALDFLVRIGALKESHTRDPFGRRYRISDDRRVTSDGPDGKPNTPDDLTVVVGDDGKAREE